jgi:crossover junction endodeoxyribonuclease RuvC
MKPSPQNPVRILGLDPGLRFTGWGVLEAHNNTIKGIAWGVVSPPSSDDLSVRLANLMKGLTEIINNFQPEEAAVEETFVNKNPTSTLKLGMARGVVMCAPSLLNIPVFEYSANKVKKSVVGAGHSDKHQVTTMVNFLLSGMNASADGADALAVAICHAHYRGWNDL